MCGGAQFPFFRLLVAKEFDTRGYPVRHFRALADCTSWGKVFGTFFLKFGEFPWQQTLVRKGSRDLILQQLIRRRIVSVSTVKENVLDVAEPYGFIVAAPVIWHLGRTVHLLHLEDHEKADS